MASRLENGEVLFSELIFNGRSRRIKTKRPVKPVVLKDVSEPEYHLLMRSVEDFLEIKRVRRPVELVYNGSKVFLKLNNSPKDNYGSFASVAEYDAVADEIARLKRVLDEKGGEARLYWNLVGVLREVRETV